MQYPMCCIRLEVMDELKQKLVKEVASTTIWGKPLHFGNIMSLMKQLIETALVTRRLHHYISLFWIIIMAKWVRPVIYYDEMF